jgi:hypothetical protein
MLSKPTGSTGYFALNATTGTFHAVTNQTGDLADNTVGTLPARKVRIAVTQAAVINFGTNIADNNSDILMPAGHVEHFSLNTSTVTYVKITGGTDGVISITPVA